MKAVRTMRNRLKSWVFWSSLAAQIVSILVAAEVIDFALGETVNSVVAGVLQCFVLFGVLNNPTDAEHF